MKKFGRTIWVWVLSALAFLGACGTGKNLTKAERAQLIQERDSIQRIIKSRESACVYGSPEVIREFGAETNRLRQQVKDINARLGEKDEEKSIRPTRR